MRRRSSTPATLEHAIHRMVHHGEHTVEELADLLGWSESSLYRASNPHDKPLKRSMRPSAAWPAPGAA